MSASSVGPNHGSVAVMRFSHGSEVRLLLNPTYDPSIHLKKNKGSPVAQSVYAKITSSVMFLMNYTHPDIAYAINRLSRYTHNLAYEH